MPPKNLNLETLAARTYLDGVRANRPLSLPIVRGASFTAPTAAEHARLYRDNEPTFYQRFGHVASDAAAERLALLEGAEAAAAFSSGMAAVSSAVLSQTDRNTHIVSGEQIFAQSSELFSHLAEVFGVNVDFVDTRDPGNVRAAVRNGADVIYVETPSNPQLHLTDIAEIAEITRSCGAILIVDSTFATPFGQRPLELGADLVVHSGTKLLSGHMDLMCGFVAGRRELVAKASSMQRLLGGVLDPQAAWLYLRGLKTLGVRAARVFESARVIAECLSKSPKVAAVRYPLLESDPQFDIAKRQMTGGGGVVSFSLNGGREAARRFVNGLQLIEIATSLGGTETTIELPYDLDWVEMTDQADSDSADLGLIRLSVGLEHCDDILSDILAALEGSADS